MWYHKNNGLEKKWEIKPLKKRCLTPHFMTSRGWFFVMLLCHIYQFYYFESCYVCVNFLGPHTEYSGEWKNNNKNGIGVQIWLRKIKQNFKIPFRKSTFIKHISTHLVSFNSLNRENGVFPQITCRSLTHPSPLFWNR